MKDGFLNAVNELIKKSKLPHAVLIDSGSPAERNEAALYIASSFLCESHLPCGICKSCIKVKNGSHPDVIIADPELVNEKTFKVDIVRNIKKDVYILPNESKYKIYILKSADKMNVSAQNAILKTLEEPPSYARFILLCDSRSAMLETIMSRVTAFSLGAGSNSYLSENEQKADMLANELAMAMTEVTELKFMRLSSSFEKDKDLLPLVLSSIQLIFRDAVAISTGSNLTLSGHTDTARTLASKLSVKTLIELVGNTEDFSASINKNANKNLLITRFCSVLRNTAYAG